MTGPTASRLPDLKTWGPVFKGHIMWAEVQSKETRSAKTAEVSGLPYMKLGSLRRQGRHLASRNHVLAKEPATGLPEISPPL